MTFTVITKARTNTAQERLRGELSEARMTLDTVSAKRLEMERLYLNYAHDQRFERCRTRLMPPVAEQLS